MTRQYTVLQLAHLDDTGDSLHRIRWPGRQLAEQAPHWRIINLSMEAAERYAWAEQADLLVLYQSHDLDLLPIIARRKSRGLPTLAEYNDNFYDPPPASNAAAVWRSPLIWQNYELIMNACDALIVTGPGLQQTLSAKTAREIFILENHCPATPPDFAQVWTAPDEKFCLGWAGSAGHMADILAITPMLRELMAEYPCIQLHLMGNAFFKAYHGLDRERLVCQDWGTMDDYFDFLKPLHVGLAPMIDTPYNHCRSDIKAVEMGSQGVLPLLPDRLPYRKILGATALEAYTSITELRDRILFYVNSHQDLQEDAQRFHGYIRQHRVGPSRTDRLALYQRMMPDRAINADWPLPPGYHEVHGTRATHAPTHALTQKVATLFGNKQFAQGLAMTREARKENPAHPDLALLELRILAAMPQGNWRRQLREAQTRFPADLRFDLFGLRHEREPARQRNLWSAVLGHLRGAGPLYLEFHEQEVTSLMCESLQENPALLGHAERMLAIYPAALALVQKVALACEAQDDFRQARMYFQRIADTRTQLAGQGECLEKIDRAWLETWRNTLAARVSEIDNQ